LKIFYCKKLRATTLDQGLCQKRQRKALEDTDQKGEAPYSFWPCLGCEGGLKVLKVRSLKANSILPVGMDDSRGARSPQRKRRRKRARRAEAAGD